MVLPLCNTAAMTLHLAEISTRVSSGRHAVLLLDQAGWHLSGDVVLPDNAILFPLPPKCSELTVMENVWQFMRTTVCRNACSGATTTLSRTAATTGTASSFGPGASVLINGS